MLLSNSESFEGTEAPSLFFNWIPYFTRGIGTLTFKKPEYSVHI